MIGLTYYGHSTFLLDIAGEKVLFDPFISANELAKDIDISMIKPDYILVTHGHSDHVADVEQIAKASGAKLIANFEIATWFANKGISNYHPMNHGGKLKLPFGTVKMVNAIHSSTLPDGASGGNPAGFVIETAQGTFYYAGDTALTYDMKLIGESYDIDFAFLPIGDNFTMDIHDAIKAADFVKTDKIIGMHYDTFGYIKVDHEAIKAAAKQAGKQLHILKIGEKTNI
ncbi:metal-dependent hydrolase [Penaeicola halotolerans]|uniref:metal-dependent hydrolase n=1 Tax=Penaeicola halotolerans TaxID=2793196 RepID=UPI001CF87715|nr:metal-dependent hydrolase [Penaeicola halotolerans]